MKYSIEWERKRIERIIDKIQSDKRFRIYPHDEEAKEYELIKQTLIELEHYPEYQIREHKPGYQDTLKKYL